MNKTKDTKMEQQTRAAGANAGDQQPKKKSKGFLSFLNCCNASDETDEIGMQDAPQSNKPVTQSQSAKLPSSQAQNPQVKQQTQDGDEKDTPPAFVDTPTSPSLPTDQTATTVASRIEPTAETEQPEPSGSTTLGMDHIPTATGVGAATLASQNPSANPDTSQNQTQQQLPIQPTEDEHMIVDRTDEQRARDVEIEMTDNGPNVPLSKDEVATTGEVSDKDSSKVDLPPPPPVQQRAAAVLAPQQEITGRESPAGQKWLLPPMRPEHKGRKCLILDLDETLVHSSFKVCPPNILLRSSSRVPDLVGYMLENRMLT